MEDQNRDLVLNWIRNHFFGKYRGLVKNNNDPTHRGRVKVEVPAVLDNLQVWALPCLPYTGKNAGLYSIPEPGADVWVEFEGGDPSYPIWTGGFWADNELPIDEQQTEATPSLRMIRSEKGLMISFNDKSEILTISDQNGKNMVTIDVQKGETKLKADIKVVVEAPQIELIENSTHALILGDNLLQYLNQMVTVFATHTHPGQGTPVAPMPPATPSLLSTKVKTG